MIAGDMLILLLNDILKPMVAINDTDQVITVNHKNLQISQSYVHNFTSKIVPALFMIVLANGNFLRSTNDHKILIKTGETFEMISVTDLKINNLAVIYSLKKFEYMPILSINKITSQPVYQFVTDSDNHNYIANTFIVSN